MIERVRDGAVALEDPSTSKTEAPEALVITTAGRGDAGDEFGGVEGRNVSDEEARLLEAEVVGRERDLADFSWLAVAWEFECQVGGKRGREGGGRGDVPIMSAWIMRTTSSPRALSWLAYQLLRTRVVSEGGCCLEWESKAKKMTHLPRRPCSSPLNAAMTTLLLKVRSCEAMWRPIERRRDVPLASSSAPGAVV